MEGQHFDTVDVMKQKSLERLMSISSEAYSDCIDQWKKRWEKCLRSYGEYFEGVSI